jgi:hypothetical protein
MEKSNSRKLSHMTFVEIPQEQIKDNSEYGRWLVDVVERKWMTEFNQGNEDWYPVFVFNINEHILRGFFGKTYTYCKLYRYDGSMAFVVHPFIAHRGFEITDHHDTPGVGKKVQLITNNLERFLKQEKIEYRRKDI